MIYRRGGTDAPSEHWRSNVHQRIVAWSGQGCAWWMGRWSVAGFPVQVLYTRGVASDPVSALEREDVRRVRFEQMDIAVVPLEYLLAESAARNQAQTTNRILHALRSSGFSADTLNRALDSLPSDKALRLLRLLEIRLVAG